jgi:hypothetical protein
MRAILEFDLPDDQNDFTMALNGSKWHSVAWDLDQFLRSKVKHGDGEPKEMEMFGKVREQLFEIMEDHGVTFE